MGGWVGLRFGVDGFGKGNSWLCRDLNPAAISKKLKKLRTTTTTTTTTTTEVTRTYDSVVGRYSWYRQEDFHTLKQPQSFFI